MEIPHLVDGPEVGRRLNVSVRRVHQLGEAGAIQKVARGLYDARSIDVYLAARRGARSRPWTHANAWAAVALLSDGAADVAWLPERSLFRLRAALRTMTVDELVNKTRTRAEVHRFHGHPSTARRLRSHVISKDWRCLGLAGATADHLDGYIDTAEFDMAGKRHLLTPDLSGRITLRVTELDPSIVRALVAVDSVVVALDAAAEIDPRARGVGERALAQILARFAGDTNARV